MSGAVGLLLRRIIGRRICRVPEKDNVTMLMVHKSHFCRIRITFLLRKTPLVHRTLFYRNTRIWTRCMRVQSVDVLTVPACVSIFSCRFVWMSTTVT